MQAYWDVESFAILCNALVRYKDACQLVDASSVLIGGRLEPNPTI